MVQYIEVGPKGSKLERLAEKKVVNGQPIVFPKWEDKNIKTAKSLFDLPNDLPIAIHTGKSGLLVIDFDDDLYFTALELNNELTPELQCSYITKSVGKTGGHFVYKYADNMLTAFIDNPNGKKLGKVDCLYGNTLLFASNQANTTKEVVESGDTLVTMPIAMQQLIIARYAQTQHSSEVKYTQANNMQGTKLAMLAEDITKSDECLEAFLHIVTPKRYKHIMSQSRKKLIPNHPDRLPEVESAHMYLVAISGVLMLDESIEPTLHKKTIQHLNSLFGTPLDKNRVLTIVNRDCNSDNYKYDPNWKTKSFIINTKEAEPIEVFMYTSKGQINYLVFNHLTHFTESYNSSSGVLDFLKSVTKQDIKKERLLKSAVHVSIINRPDEPFGYNYDNKTFNMYIWSEEQQVFYNPNDYKATWREEYQTLTYNCEHPYWPKITLQVLEKVIGTDRLHNLFLPFMKRKYATRDHSPLFFVLYGVPFSFKSAVVEGIFGRLSKSRHKRISIDVLCDKYNDWMVDTDLILIDEVHQLSSFDRARMIKAINETSGNEIIAGVRRMHQTIDAKMYNQEITFFLTTNLPIQLTTEARDRRMVVFKNLTEISKALDMSNEDIKRAIIKESKFFAYYLSVEVSSLEGDSYIANYKWKEDSYVEFQEQSQSIESRLAKQIDQNNFAEFMNVFIEAGGTIELLAKAIYKPMKKPHYNVRLYNTREDVASHMGLFNNIPIDINAIRKAITTISHIGNSLVDYEKGCNVRTGSKKSEWYIYQKDIPKEVFKLIPTDTVEAFEEVDV
ncbi:MAG: hypothetical protein AB7D38_12050 [Sulfurimonas sp.]|uniref:hypothetical protein n=1 Tax=Sulfurimonas sp. TaxID=2022749 RepID=UPI003D102A7E